MWEGQIPSNHSYPYTWFAACPITILTIAMLDVTFDGIKTYNSYFEIRGTVMTNVKHTVSLFYIKKIPKQINPLTPYPLRSSNCPPSNKCKPCPTVSTLANIEPLRRNNMTHTSCKLGGGGGEPLLTTSKNVTTPSNAWTCQRELAWLTYRSILKSMNL